MCIVADTDTIIIMQTSFNLRRSRGGLKAGRSIEKYDHNGGDCYYRKSTYTKDYSVKLTDTRVSGYPSSSINGTARRTRQTYRLWLLAWKWLNVLIIE